MRALLYDEPGGPEVLRLVEVADPEPGPADVVVRVAACGVNRLDAVQRNGWFQLPGFVYPHIAGMDVAGEVVAVGADVDGVHPGDRVVIDPSMVGVPAGSRLAGRGDPYGDLAVIGATADGGYAELCLAPATHVYPVPHTVPFEHAAVFPTSYLTAGHAVFAVGQLQAGETVLIHAAGSGVSTAAIQLAVHAGAVVLATAGSAAKLDRAQSLGARHVLNNRTDDVTAWAREVTDGAGVDMVLDHVGTALFGPSVLALGVGGRLVCCGNTSGDTATIPSLGFVFHHGIRILGSDYYRPDEFTPLWEMFCSGSFEAVIDAVYPLEDAGAAQERLIAGDVVGKLVLRP